MASHPLLSVLSHPVVTLLALNVASTFVLMLTSPKSVIRPGALILMIMVFWYSLSTYLPRLGRVPWAAFLAGTALTTILQYVEFALLRGWTLDGQGQTLFLRQEQTGMKRDGKGLGWRQRLYFGYFLATSTRHIETSYQVKGVPDFFSKDPAFIPSRRQFLFKRAAISLVCYLALDLAALGSRLQRPDASIHSPQRIPFLTRVGDISRHEMATRLQDTVGYYLFCYCLIQCYTSVLACVVVGLDIDSVEYWRPNFDGPWEAYSLRQFWGVFWHQHLRSKLSTLADFVTYKLLLLRKGSLIARYTNMFLSFSISAVVHFGTVVAAGFTVRQSSGAFQYFCTQTLGIIVEDGLQAAYRRIRGLHRQSKQSSPWWARSLGYLWVLLFLTWTTPPFIYPMLLANTGTEKDDVLPFSPIQFLQQANTRNGTKWYDVYIGPYSAL